MLAASGMCQGGRIINYLQAMLDKPENDLVFVGYQARGTLGNRLQNAEPGDWLDVQGKRVQLKAQIHRLSGFSAHADQAGLLDFCTNMPTAPRQVRLVHGDMKAKQALQALLKERLPGCDVVIPR